MATQIKNFLQHNPVLSYGSLGLCAVASFEMGCRSVMNLTKLYRSTNEAEKKEFKKDLTADLSGTFLLGLSATNGFPGLRKGAAVVFVVRAFRVFLNNPKEKDRKKEYFIGRAITFFPDQSYQGYKKIKSKLNLPSHPSWYLLIGAITLVGYYQLFGQKTYNHGQKLYNYFTGNKSS